MQQQQRRQRTLSSAGWSTLKAFWPDIVKALMRSGTSTVARRVALRRRSAINLALAYPEIIPIADLRLLISDHSFLARVAHALDVMQLKDLQSQDTDDPDHGLGMLPRLRHNPYCRYIKRIETSTTPALKHLRDDPALVADAIANHMRMLNVMSDELVSQRMDILRDHLHHSWQLQGSVKEQEEEEEEEENWKKGDPIASIDEIVGDPITSMDEEIAGDPVEKTTMMDWAAGRVMASSMDEIAAAVVIGRALLSHSRAAWVALHERYERRVAEMYSITTATSSSPPMTWMDAAARVVAPGGDLHTCAEEVTNSHREMQRETDRVMRRVQLAPRILKR